MFSLAALGAGLGQGMQQIQQQQEAAQRAQMARILLQNQQRQQLAQQLMGEVLTAGGIPGMGGGGLGSLGNMRPQPLPGMQPPQAPMAGPTMGIPGPQAPALPPQPRDTLMPPVEGESMTPAPGTYPMPLDDDEPTVSQEAQAAQRAGTEPSDAEIARSASPSPAPAGGAPAETTAAASPPPASAGVSLEEAPSYLSMFHSIDPQAIARRIKEVRPDAPSDAIAMATESIYKMAQGSSREQIAAASMMKYLIGEQGRNQRFQQSQSTAQQRIATTQRGQDISAGVRREGYAAAGERAAAGREAAAARQQQRLDEQRYQRALSRADTQTKAQLSELHRQLGDMDRRINQILNTGQPQGRDKPELDNLLRSRQSLAEREQKMAEPFLGGQQ